MDIPRILHQIGPAQLSPLQEACKASLLHHHPHWTYRFWTEKALARLIRKHYPEAAATFDASVALGRYALLHRFGGVFVDLTVEWRSSIDALLTGPLCLAQDPATVDPQVTSTIMASTAGHPVWTRVLREVVRRHREREWPWWAITPAQRAPFVTGSHMLSAVVRPSSTQVFQEPYVLHCALADPVAPETVAVQRPSSTPYGGSAAPVVLGLGLLGLVLLLLGGLSATRRGWNPTQVPSVAPSPSPRPGGMW